VADVPVSRPVVVTLGCCLVAAILAVINQAGDTTLWTAVFAVVVLLVATALVGYATLRMLGGSDGDDDSADDPH
jgi:cobalamin synthase